MSGSLQSNADDWHALYPVLANPLGKMQASPSVKALNEVLNTLTITDSKGGSQTLCFGGDGGGQIPEPMQVMPSLPAVGAFDARCKAAEGGSTVRTHNAKVSGELPVSIQSDAYPLTVTWTVSRGTASYELTDGVGGQMFRAREMTGEGSIKIPDSELKTVTVKLIGDRQLPKKLPFHRIVRIRSIRRLSSVISCQ